MNIQVHQDMKSVYIHMFKFINCCGNLLMCLEKKMICLKKTWKPPLSRGNYGKIFIKIKHLGNIFLTRFL